MAFLNIPLKSIEAALLTAVGVESMPWYNPLSFPVAPGAPAPTPLQKDFRWRVVMDINDQQQSSSITRQPGKYNGQDISVGQWIANLTTGQSWQIISIESKTEIAVTAIVQDIYRYNTFRDPVGSGNGNPVPGTYVVFSLSDSGNPEIDPVPASGISSQFSTNLISRFQYINLQYDFPLYQSGNTFQINDVIAANSTTNSFVKSDAVNKFVVGRVTSISDTIPGWFTINPVQKIVDYLDYLPGDVGDIIYASTTVPGEITDTPDGAQLYVKLRNNTSSVSASTLVGAIATGNTFQLNGFNVTITAPGTLLSIVTATNLIQSNTGVTATSQLAPTTAQTNNALITSIYGEPALFASSSPATATINGVLVTFNITSSDPGYEDYARPAQMAQSINNANIPNIVASAPNALTLKITNLIGGAITIINITSDTAGVPVAGSNSGIGIVLSTPVSTISQLIFTAVDARAINFIDVIGTTIEDYGIPSVENGVKACGLYIEGGLRTASTTVVSNLIQLQLLTPLIGDQAYVIDSIDANGNNTNEWSLWLYNGSIWIKTSSQDSASTDAKSLEYTIIPASPVSVDIGTISTGRRVALITVEVLTPFDGTSTLDIGYRINNPSLPPPVPAGLMSTGIIDLTISDTYSTTTDILFGTDTIQGDVIITANFNNIGSTVGMAQIIVSYV